MNKQDDPTSIWYTGAFFEEDPQQKRRPTPGTPLRLAHTEAELGGTGAMLTTAATVQAIAAQATSATRSLSSRRSKQASHTGPGRRATAVGAGARPAVPLGSASSSTPPRTPAALAADPADADEIATLHELLGAPQLLKGESLAAYNRLYAAVRGALNPGDIVDEMDVREIVDVAWELRRYKSFRLGLLDGAFEDAVVDVLKDMLSEAWIRSNAKRRGAGDPAAHAKMRQALARAGVSEDTLRGRVLEDYLDSVERLESLIDKLLERRTRLLQEMARRRDQRDPPE